MRRRDVLFAIGGTAIGWPLPGKAEERVRRIGILTALAEDDPAWRRNVASLVAGLKDAGWFEGQNYRFEIRYVPGGTGVEPFTLAAAELVAATPDLILAAPGTTAGVAVQRETKVIPLVFLLSFDPVAEGLVGTIPHPGGNATGFFVIAPPLAGKWLQLLKEIAPSVTRTICLFGPSWTTSTNALSRFHSEFWEAMDQSARSSSVSVTQAVAHDDKEIENALTALSEQPGGGLIVAPDSFIAAHRTQIIESAARLRVPAVYPIRFYSVDGGLLSYGADVADVFRQSAGYVDRILRGASPADLPAQGPRKFEMVVNLRTAKALGLTVPPSLLLRADEVIE